MDHQHETIHEFVLDKLRDQVLSYLDEHDGSISDFDILRFIFKNYTCRGGRHHGIRLTSTGFRLLSKEYDAHVYENTEWKMVNQSLIKLDKYMTWPYYVSHRKVAFFSQEDAAWFKLNGGTLADYVETL